MTDDSLFAFSRVRLYTAIYPEGDVADFTERFYLDSIVAMLDFPVLSLRELSLKRLPSVNPLRYQSPIALSLGAKLKISPATIAQAICQGSLAKRALDFDWDEAGWITLTWNSAEMVRALAGLCAGWQEPLLEASVPFWLWRMINRVRSLREQVQLFHPEFDPLLSVSIDYQMPDPVQDLLEALVIFFDRRSDGRSENLIVEYRSLCDAFEQMHRQIPLFSVTTSVSDRYAAWLVLGWFQEILKFRETTDK